MDPHTRAARRLAAHTTLASRHPWWELVGRRLAWLVLPVAAVLLGGWQLVSRAGRASESARGRLGSLAADWWPLAVLVLVSLVALGLAWRWYRSPYRVPRRWLR